MADDYKIQANINVNGNLFNIRGDSVEEVRNHLEGLATNGGEIGEAMGQFKQAVLAKDVFTGGGNSAGGGKPSNTPNRPIGSVNADGVPTCAHGPMKDLRGSGYKADFYCTAPKGQTQCKPVKL